MKENISFDRLAEMRADSDGMVFKKRPEINAQPQRVKLMPKFESTILDLDEIAEIRAGGEGMVVRSR